MRVFTALFFAALVFNTIVADEAPDPDKTGVLKAKLDRYVRLVKSFDKERHYVMATVDVWQTSMDGAPLIDQRIYVTAYEPASGHKMSASSLTILSTDLDSEFLDKQDREIWQMQFTKDGRTFQRGGFPQWGREYKMIELDEDGYDVSTTKEMKKHTQPSDPIEFKPLHCAWINPWFLFKTKDATESLEGDMKYDGHMKSASFDKNRDIVAVFESSVRVSDNAFTRWERKLAKTAQYMPCEQKLFHVEPSGATLVAHSRTKWATQNGRLLPVTVEVVTFNGPQESHYTVKYEYVLGDRCPTNDILDFELNDWREPLRALFDTDWAGSQFRSEVFPGE